MRLIPLILLFVYVYLEISFFILVADAIGVFLALICVIATSVIGLSLVKSQGIKNLAMMQQKMALHENPTNELIRSVSLLLAGFLLLIPGFLTDIIGAIFLLPPVQQFLIKFIVPKMNITTRFYRKGEPESNNNIIEGEFKRKDDE